MRKWSLRYIDLLAGALWAVKVTAYDVLDTALVEVGRAPLVRSAGRVTRAFRP